MRKTILAVLSLCLTVPAFAATKTWAGGSSGVWSNPANWSPNGVPTASDSLVFPSMGLADMTVDLSAGTAIGPMTFGDGEYRLSGNSLTLMGDVAFSPNTILKCNIDLKLGTSVTFGPPPYSEYLRFNGAIDPNGNTLTVIPNNTIFSTLNGTGLVIGQYSSFSSSLVSKLSIDGGNFSGELFGYINLEGAVPNATVVAGNVDGVGTIGPLTVQPGGTWSPGSIGGYTTASLPIGTINSKSATLNGATTIDVTSGSGDQLKVTGSVTINGSLQITVFGPLPAAGEAFKIIDNDGTDPVNGTFANLPEGATVAGTLYGGSTTYPFGITYKGGDGNDVVLTRLATTSISLGQSSASSGFGESVTFPATLMSQLGTPTGTVTYMEGSTVLGTAPVVNGTASLTLNSLSIGTHTITAVYPPTSPWNGATSTSITHTVTQPATTTTVSVDTPSISFGTASHFTVTVASLVQGAGTPTGTVSLTVDGTGYPSQTLTNGVASFSIPLLDAGTHSVVATYSGDTSFTGSTSPATTATIGKASTAIAVTPLPSPAYVGVPIQLAIHVRDTTRAASLPPGTVTVSVNGKVIRQADLTGGLAHIDVGTYDPGDQQFDVAYLGGSNYQTSSLSVHDTILPPALAATAVTTPGETAHAISVPVTLSGLLPVPVTVSYATADGTAHAGDAYQATSGSLTFAPGQTTATISINVLHNGGADPIAFSVQLTNATNASIATPSVDVTIMPTVTATTYAYAQGLSIDFYAPATTTPHVPLVLWIPGFDDYDAAHNPVLALRERSRGYAVARVAYRPSSAAPYPAQLTDLLAAIAWIRTNAAMLDIDPNRIGAWGEGRGAHLAALLGVNPNAHLLAVVDVSGASDLAHLDDDALGCSAAAHDAATSPESTLLGCAIATCPSAAAVASPAQLVDAGAAPTLILHGDADCVIAPEQATRLFDAYVAASAFASTRFVAGGGHVGISSAPGIAGEIDAFLDVHLKREGARPHAGRH